ncbi:MAG: ankyrin repeat domain-containing protein [Legionellaceae bacterium]|nr:ankyrin repeat domain-containing protein [Legionellaceae bacterium]
MISSLGQNLGFTRNIKISALDDTQRCLIQRTRLHVAIAENNVVYFNALMNDPELQINQVDEERRTPLHTASFFGRYEMVCALLERGAACNQRDNKGHTPLHDAVNPIFIALTKQHVDITRTLLGRGAKPSMQAFSGFTPLNWMGKFIQPMSMTDERAEFMFVLANLLIEAGAKADEFAHDNSWPADSSQDSSFTSKRDRENDNSASELSVTHTPLTWAVSLNLDAIVRLFESNLCVDHAELDATALHLMEMSLFSDSKRQRPEGIIAPPASPASNEDDLEQPVYGAGL